VIIRHDGREVPMHIREFAAGIAAALSERKNEGWVTVICTPRKFIRKPKDAKAGQAIVEREEVLLVEPHLPEN
jgi:predicted ribosome quality control (RQC) complex YloA/Tae2 family protein